MSQLFCSPQVCRQLLPRQPPNAFLSSAVCRREGLHHVPTTQSGNLGTFLVSCLYTHHSSVLPVAFHTLCSFIKGQASLLPTQEHHSCSCPSSPFFPLHWIIPIIMETCFKLAQLKNSNKLPLLLPSSYVLISLLFFRVKTQELSLRYL